MREEGYGVKYVEHVEDWQARVEAERTAISEKICSKIKVRHANDSITNLDLDTYLISVD